MLRSVATLLGLYTVVLVAVWGLQERLIFVPEPLPADHVFDFGPDVREVAIDVPGARLSALHLRLPSPTGVVFYLHGNAGNLESWFTNVAVYRRANVDLFMIDYRGYGKSTGTIDNEAQLRADVRAAWDSIAPEYVGRRTIIVGRSLGTALAAGLGAEVSPDMTVLVSPYRSMIAMGKLQFPWVPSMLLRYPLATEDDAARITGPVLVLHGEVDRLIPMEHSEAIVERTPGAQLIRVHGAGHDDIHEFPEYQAAFGKALGVEATDRSGLDAAATRP